MRLNTVLAVAVFALIGFSAALMAQPVPEGYFRGDDGCLHRKPRAVMQGYLQKRGECISPSAKKTPAPFILATPSQVITALQCDFSAAAKATKGKKMDFSKAVIAGTLTFSLVSKDTKGMQLAVGAVPVFAAGTLAPSLEASRLTETTSSTEYTFTVEPGALNACPDPSATNWLSSKVISDEATSGGGLIVNKLATAMQFVLTQQSKAGLKLNIVPVSIGGGVEASEANTQKLVLTMDFAAKKAPPAAPLPPSAGAAK